MIIPGIETQEGKDRRLAEEALQARRDKAKVTIVEHKNKVLREGFPFMEKVIQADKDSRSDFTEYLVKKDVIPYPVNWRTADNTYLQLVDSTMLELLSNYMMQFYGTEVETSFAIIDLVNSAITIEEIDAIIAEYTGE